MKGEPSNLGEVGRQRDLGQGRGLHESEPSNLGDVGRHLRQVRTVLESVPSDSDGPLYSNSRFGGIDQTPRGHRSTIAFVKGWYTKFGVDRGSFYFSPSAKTRGLA